MYAVPNPITKDCQHGASWAAAASRPACAYPGTTWAGMMFLVILGTCLFQCVPLLPESLGFIVHSHDRLALVAVPSICPAIELHPALFALVERGPEQHPPAVRPLKPFETLLKWMSLLFDSVFVPPLHIHRVPIDRKYDGPLWPASTARDKFISWLHVPDLV